MKFFIDTADLDEIREALGWGCFAGVTTNPSLYAKTGGKLADFEPHMVKIAQVCEGLPVSAESTATTTEAMVSEGRRLCYAHACCRGCPRQHDACVLRSAGTPCC